MEGRSWSRLETEHAQKAQREGAGMCRVTGIGVGVKEGADRKSST